MGSSRATRAVAASSWPGKTVCSRRNLVAPKTPGCPDQAGFGYHTSPALASAHADIRNTV